MFTRILTLFMVLVCVACAPMVVASDRETVAIIGTGDMGDSFGLRLAGLGYTVVYGSRNPQSDKVRSLVANTGHGATASTQKDAAQRGDIVMLAIPWPAMEKVAQNLGDLTDKVVIDISWPPSDFDDDGYERITIDTSAAEMIQDWNPGAKVVKAFLSLGSNVIDDPSYAGGPVSVPIASDYRDAKEIVARITDELGLDPVDAGPLRSARNIESLAEMLLIPYRQGRDMGWNYYFRRTNYFVCNAYGGDGSDIEMPELSDGDNLAEFPNRQPPLRACDD